MANDGRGGTDIVIAQGSYIFMQDTTSGQIKTGVGPRTIQRGANEWPVTYEGKSEFRTVSDPTDAIRKSKVVPEGHYAVLINPAVEDKHPTEGTFESIPPRLRIGHKIVIPGPAMFALWPGQEASVLRGHQLRSNQYLLCRVYNEEEARINFASAKVVKVRQAEDAASSGTEEAETLFAPEELTVGKLLIIRGTDVSFYIPPTGISVVPDENQNYVRDALTLEQLEYCILLDESGNKRFVRGPEVVFPTPTEKFLRDEKSNIKFRAIELNEIQGIQVKITSSYTDEKLGKLSEGQEIFITGATHPIYYPREEHAIVKYDGRIKHFASAVPTGEARYVMNRKSGEIRTELGPMMLLPNPVEEVMIRRVLGDDECTLWYPGNDIALQINRALREIVSNAPTTRQGTVSEGDIERSARRSRGGTNYLAQTVSNSVGAQLSTQSVAPASHVSGSSVASAMDEISRASTFTSPRSITLDSKYQGVPRINVWNGYAVMVVNTKGERRVVKGPATVLLNYDETLEILSMSTGTPKSTTKLIRTPYLRIANNRVSDVISAETADSIKISFAISYLISFDTKMIDRWFNTENYIELLCQKMRSLIASKVKATRIEALWAMPLSLIEGVVFSQETERSRSFEENGMVITNIELNTFNILDNQISQLLTSAQRESIAFSVKKALQHESLAMAQATINMQTEEARAQNTARREIINIEQETLRRESLLVEARLEARRMEQEQTEAFAVAEEKVKDFRENAELERLRNLEMLEQEKRENTKKIRLEILSAEAEAVARKFGVLQGGFTEAMLAMGSQDAMTRIAEATSVQRLLGSSDLITAVLEIFNGSPLADRMTELQRRIATGTRTAEIGEERNA